MIENERLILTDVDGVLLNWNAAFDQWMRRHGYKKKLEGEYDLGLTYGLPENEAHDLAIRFNESAYIGSLPPLRDAMKYVKKLHEEHGYVFHCISAIPDTQPVWNLRHDNLKKIFGESPLLKLDCTGSSKKKMPILKEYADSGVFWVEDKITNAEIGNDLGLVTFLMSHDYNEKMTLSEDIVRVQSWKEIYEMLI